MKKIVSLLLILLLIGCGSGYKTISATEAHNMMESDDSIVIIDVRNLDEYTKEHIPGSKNIPLDNISSIDLDKETTIIVYCLSGVRSQKASEELTSMGYSNVYNIDGGIINWGYDLERE